ncbi:hypothetical protein X975_00598, partial [Stegodyphus mimosarum]
MVRQYTRCVPKVMRPIVRPAPVGSKLSHSACFSEPLCECSVEIKMEKTRKQTQSFVSNLRKRRWKLSRSISPDLSPPNFLLFPKFKKCLKGQYLGNIKAATTRLLKDIPVTDFQNTYKAWKSRWNKCVKAGWVYFEEY